MRSSATCFPSPNLRFVRYLHSFSLRVELCMPSADAHWDCFRFFTRVNTVAMSKPQVYPRSQNLWVTVRVLSRVLAPISLSRSRDWESSLRPVSSPTLCPPAFLFFANHTGVQWHFTGVWFCIFQIKSEAHRLSICYWPFTFSLPQIAGSYVLLKFLLFLWNIDL